MQTENRLSNGTISDDLEKGGHVEKGGEGCE